MTKGVLVEQLTKSFGSFQALSGVDLEVPAGTVGALLGPNGAGKTTTIRILATLEQADSGRAVVGGFDVRREGHRVRSIVALTGQYAAVDGDLTGRENLIMIGRLCRLSRPDARHRADELLERFKLVYAAGRQTRTYSGGMRRRLDLALSLVRPPQVLFLDEPTTGLDPPSREELWSVVRELQDAGTTIVLTTQYLEEADRLADQVSVINNGQIVATGRPADLKSAYGADVFELIAADRAVADQAAKVLAERAGLSEQAIDANSVTGPDGLPGPVSVTVPAGTYSVIEAIRVLEAARLRLDDIHVRRATLDEVFTALTTRSAEAAAHPAEIPRQAGSPQRTEVAPALPTEGR
jgi:daunorubicin resistance ABC transporter ATP-binding subunit